MSVPKTWQLEKFDSKGTKSMLIYTCAYNPKTTKILNLLNKLKEKTEGVIKNGQSRDIGNIGVTRNKMKTNKTKTQHRNWKYEQHDLQNDI